MHSTHLYFSDLSRGGTVLAGNTGEADDDDDDGFRPHTQLSNSSGGGGCEKEKGGVAFPLSDAGPGRPLPPPSTSEKFPLGASPCDTRTCACTIAHNSGGDRAHHHHHHHPFVPLPSFRVSSRPQKNNQPTNQPRRFRVSSPLAVTHRLIRGEREGEGLGIAETTMTAATATTDATAAAAAAGGFLPFVSALFGWVYFICWSLSFYPQPWLNYRRKSTSGTTVDFPFVNCLGTSTSAPLIPFVLVLHATVPLLLRSHVETRLPDP